jgi:type I restriction enzyme, R subunit
MLNQNPKQIARDHIDKRPVACGWVIQDIKKVNLHAGTVIAVREYSKDGGENWFSRELATELKYMQWRNF